MPVLHDDELPLTGGGGPTLTGGAQFKTAAGGLPARLTAKDDIVIDDVIADHGGIMFDPNGSFFWVASFTAGTLVRRNVSDGTTSGVTATVTQPMGLFAYDATRFYCADWGANLVREFNYSGTQLATMAFTGPMQAVRVPGVSDKVWVIAYPSGTPTEYTFSTGVATGRTIAITAHAIWATAGFVYVVDTNAVKKYAEASLTLQKTWTFLVRNSSHPGHTFNDHIRDVFVAADDKPIVYNGLHHNVDRLVVDPAGIDGQEMVDRRLLYAQPQLGGAGNFPNSVLTFAVHPAYCHFGDNALFATTRGDAQAAGVFTLRLRNLFGTQRARWSKSFGEQSTVTRIAAGGNWCGDRGATYDLRKVKFYYSLDGGSIRTEFMPGATLGISLAAGASLTVDMDIIEADGQATNPPYVEAMQVIYSTPDLPIPPPPLPDPILPDSVSTVEEAELYGTATTCVSDLPSISVQVAGRRAVAEALVRRLTTPRGGLATIDPSPEAAEYGFDIRQYVNAKIGPAEITAAEAAIANECAKDERVESCVATLTFVRETGKLTISLEVTLSTGPFTLVLGVTELTVEILELAA